jgi:phosphocarrier protein HPr
LSFCGLDDHLSEMPLTVAAASGRLGDPTSLGALWMTQKTLIVQNRLGLHARPAALVVSEASKYHSEIYLNKDGVEINAKSIMGVMMLAAEMGSHIMVTASGEDEQEAVAAIEALFASKFDEE